MKNYMKKWFIHMFQTDQWDAGKKIIETLQSHGFEAYFVGGAVRDYVRGEKANDIDIATSALPPQVKMIFKRTVDIGLDHGTVLVIEEGSPIEVTTFRTDGEYADHRRPTDVKFVLSLEEDLQRRDFTMNALAMTEKLQVIDLFNGKNDLANGIIRTVGLPLDRFKEDALRMLRAIRFSAQLGFSIEPATLQAIKDCAGDISHVSVERITAELEKIWMSNHLLKGIQYLVDTHLANHFPGECQFSNEKWSRLESPQNSVVCWTFLCLLQEQPKASKLAKIFRLSNDLKKQINQLMKATQIRMERIFTTHDLYLFEETMLIQAEVLSRVLNPENVQMQIDDILQAKRSLPIQSAKDLVVTGQDLMAWFKKPGGPWLKETLAHVEHAVLHQNVENDAIKLKEWIMNESNSEI